MRVIDCECGTTLKAGNDEDLAGQVREHLADVHDDRGRTDQDLREFVSAKAYDATDA